MRRRWRGPVLIGALVLGAALLVTVYQLADLRAALLVSIGVVAVALVVALRTAVTGATGAARPGATTAADG